MPDWSTGFGSLGPEEASSLPGFDDHLSGRTMSDEDRVNLGRAWVFHRVFRDRMR